MAICVTGTIIYSIIWILYIVLLREPTGHIGYRITRWPAIFGVVCFCLQIQLLMCCWFLPFLTLPYNIFNLLTESFAVYIKLQLYEYVN
jgi:hypothetical protein